MYIYYILYIHIYGVYIYTHMHTYMPILFSLAHIELLSRCSAPCSSDVAILVPEDALAIQHSS